MAEELGERVLDTPQNPISIAMTVDSLRERLQRRQKPAASTAGTPASAAVGRTSDPPHGAACSADPEHAGLGHAGTPACAGSSASEAPAPRTSDAGGEAPASAGRNGAATAGGAAARSERAEAGEGRHGGSGVRGETASVLGALLWQRHVSGVRVVCMGKRQSVGGVPFEGYGSSCDSYGHDYMTAAAALGGTREDVDRFVAKVRKCWAAV